VLQPLIGRTIESHKTSESISGIDLATITINNLAIDTTRECADSIRRNAAVKRSLLLAITFASIKLAEGVVFLTSAFGR